jgi:alpha/beta hydrolase fold
MRTSLFKRLACALLLCGSLAICPRSFADDKSNIEHVKFDTADFVEIHGTLYAGGNGAKSACVILLHQLGGNSQQEGWGALAEQLQKKGFTVLAFDFRGHGESTVVGPGFWRVPRNQSLRSYRPGKLRDQISYKDFSNRDNWLDLVNDISGAKRFLDRRNDAGDCNSSNIILIGAEGGATLGLVWSWCEHHIVPVQFNFPIIQNRGQTEGSDLSCAVWLSLSPTIGAGNSKYSINLDTCVQSPVREKLPMYFLYGEQDTKATNLARHLVDGKMHAEKGLKYTGKKAVKDTKLAGNELLGKDSLGTMTDIMAYVGKVMDEHAFNASVRHDVDRQVPQTIQAERFLYR